MVLVLKFQFQGFTNALDAKRKSPLIILINFHRKIIINTHLIRVIFVGN